MSNVMNETHMLEETGRVVAVNGHYAVIEIQKRSACGHCHSGDSCGTSVLAGLFSNHRQKVTLENHLNLSEGDQVVIGINETVLLSTAVMAYMLPLLLMIGLAVISNLSGMGDGFSFVSSMVGLFAGMRISNRIMGNKDFQSKEIVLLRNADTSFLQGAGPNSI